MRYGIISDVHSSLEALNAVLEHLGTVDKVVCPGDIVGYGPNPNECCAILKKLDAVTVLGNHDAVCVGRHDLEWFNPHAQAAVLWTRERLAKRHADHLLQLKEVRAEADFVLVHGSLKSPLDFEYITSPWQAIDSFAAMGNHRICFVGHTHIAEAYVHKVGNPGVEQILLYDGGKIALQPGFKYIVNCGSVGQPRDGNPLASFGIYDSDEDTIEVFRVEYDLVTTQKKMREAVLPQALWQRLEFGM